MYLRDLSTNDLYRIPDPDNHSIYGRECDVVVAALENTSVAQRHCMITCDKDGKLRILNMCQQPQGTRLNGSKLHGETPLNHGDIVKIGVNTKEQDVKAVFLKVVSQLEVDNDNLRDALKKTQAELETVKAKLDTVEAKVRDELAMAQSEFKSLINELDTVRNGLETELQKTIQERDAAIVAKQEAENNFLTGWENGEDVAELQNKVKELEAELATAQAAVDSAAQPEIQTWQVYDEDEPYEMRIAELEKQLAAEERKNANMGDANEEYRNEIARLKADKTTLQARVETLQQGRIIGNRHTTRGRRVDFDDGDEGPIPPPESSKRRRT